jgi:ABC-type nitrate/sulfonate/bicarbonate transport system permease component
MQKIYLFLEQDTRAASIARIGLSVSIILIVWEIVAHLVSNRLLIVPPLEVWAALLKEYQSGAIFNNAIATVTAVVTSFVVSVIVGVGIGLALASNRLLSLTFGPILSALNSVPIIALAPLFIAWLGLGFSSKFVLVLLVAIFPVVVTTEAGLRATDKQLIEAASSFNATRYQIFTTVTFPFALPFIVSGVRVAWARALVGIVVAEFFGSFAGFGYAIMSASQTFDTARVLGYVLVLGAMGLIGSVAFASLERKLAPWRLD